MAPILSQAKRCSDGVVREVYSPLGVSTPVIRAASVEITRLFVTAELIGTEAAVELANRLAASFDVEAVVGFPEYTTHDWDTRPDWMRTEPWRTLYAVDAVMSGFTRDSREAACSCT